MLAAKATGLHQQGLHGAIANDALMSYKNSGRIRHYTVPS